MLISIMKNSVLYALYDYDKELFISIFCENKDRPQLKCNGKCKFAEMQKEQNEKDANNRLKQLQTEIVYYYPISSLDIAYNDFYSEEIVRKEAYLNSLYSFLYTSQLVKPPDTVVNVT